MNSTPPPRAFASIALCLLLGAAASLIAGCGRSQPPPLGSQDQAVLGAYEQIRAALANDDFPGARKHATELDSLVKSSDPNARASTIEADAQTIIDATALDRQREALRSLSAQLEPLVKGRPGYYIFSSPLEPQAIWIQRDASPGNPYMGKVMHDSGAVVP